MTEFLYQTDSYLKEFETKVTEINQDENAIMLESTPFYPGGGGQPSDIGQIQFEGSTVQVKKVKNKGKCNNKLGSPLPIDAHPFGASCIMWCCLARLWRTSHRRQYGAAQRQNGF